MFLQNSESCIRLPSSLSRPFWDGADAVGSCSGTKVGGAGVTTVSQRKACMLREVVYLTWRHTAGGGPVCMSVCAPPSCPPSRASSGYRHAGRGSPLQGKVPVFPTPCDCMFNGACVPVLQAAWPWLGGSVYHCDAPSRRLAVHSCRTRACPRRDQAPSPTSAKRALQMSCACLSVLVCPSAHRHGSRRWSPAEDPRRETHRGHSLCTARHEDKGDLEEGAYPGPATGHRGQSCAPARG